MDPNCGTKTIKQICARILAILVWIIPNIQTVGACALAELPEQSPVTFIFISDLVSEIFGAPLKMAKTVSLL